jgi:hypothetical protein
MPYYYGNMRLKAFLIMFLMLSFVTAPVFDAVACDDCAGPMTSQRGGGNIRQLPDLAEEAGHDENQTSPSRGTAKDLCPLCANAAVGIVAMTCHAPCDALQSAGQPKLLAFSDPSYPITKPPQN